MRPAIVDIVLAGLNVDRELRDAISGDLIEGRARLAETHGGRYADWWVWRQVFVSVPSLVQSSARGQAGSVLAGMIGSAVAAMLVVLLVIGASAKVVSVITPADTLGRALLVMLAIDLAYGVAGGYLAARFGPRAPFGAALVFGLLGLAISMGSVGEQVTRWYQLALMFLLLPATLLGGWVRAREIARSTT